MRFRFLPLLIPFCALGVLAAAPPKAEPQKELPDGTAAATKQIAQFKLPAGMKAELWAAEPKLSSPVAISVDEKGRVYAAEEYRLGKGAAENRGNPAFNFTFFLEDDLQIRTLDDRLKAYRKWQDKVPGGYGYFTANSDQVRRLEDTTGSGRADKSTIFAGGFNSPLDGLMAGVLARDGDVYVTNIPSLYKLKDTKGTGIADVKEELLTGFGVNIAFYGHDLHGLIFGPDGKLYFSVGDRGFNVTSKEGKAFVGPRHGAVFRCNTDGTEFEVVHRGLRNPQELAFDEHGNLFADDNNCDKGDHARLVYIVDGGESGWNMAYQTIPEPYLTGPWHAERLWHLPHAGQAAYIVPPVGSIGTGPSGFLFTSGTSLPKRYENAFIMCNYTGIGGLEAFKVKEKGAGFEIVDYHDFLKPISATDFRGTEPPDDVGTGRFSKVWMSRRAFSESDTVIGTCRSDSENLALFCSMSPSVAIRIVWLNAAVVTPRSAARSNRGLMVISGCARLLPTRGARSPGTVAISLTSWLATLVN